MNSTRARDGACGAVVRLWEMRACRACSARGVRDGGGCEGACGRAARRVRGGCVEGACGRNRGCGGGAGGSRGGAAGTCSEACDRAHAVQRSEGVGSVRKAVQGDVRDPTRDKGSRSRVGTTELRVPQGPAGNPLDPRGSWREAKGPEGGTEGAETRTPRDLTGKTGWKETRGPDRVRAWPDPRGRAQGGREPPRRRERDHRTREARTHSPSRGCRVGEAAHPGPAPPGNGSYRTQHVPGDGQCLFHALAVASGEPEGGIRARLEGAIRSGAVGRYFHEAGIPAEERNQAVEEYIAALHERVRGNEMHMQLFAHEYAVTLWVRQDPEGDFMKVGSGPKAVYIRWRGSAWDAPDAHFDALLRNPEPEPGPGPSEQTPAATHAQRTRGGPKGGGVAQKHAEPEVGDNEQNDESMEERSPAQLDTSEEKDEHEGGPESKWRPDRSTWPGKIGPKLRILTVNVGGPGKPSTGAPCRKWTSS